MYENIDYKEIYEKYLAYEKSQHEINQKRIRVGLRVNVLFPLIFLVLSFAISEARLVFLMLWIISLFVISGYLIYVEYNDYKMMQRLEEFGFHESLSEDVPLIAEAADFIERLEKVEENRHA